MGRKRKHRRLINDQIRTHGHNYDRPRKHISESLISQPIRRRGRPRNPVPSQAQLMEPLVVPSDKKDPEEPFKNLGIPGKYLSLFKSSPLDKSEEFPKHRRIGKRGPKCIYIN